MWYTQGNGSLCEGSPSPKVKRITRFILYITSNVKDVPEPVAGGNYHYLESLDHAFQQINELQERYGDRYHYVLFQKTVTHYE